MVVALSQTEPDKYLELRLGIAFVIGWFKKADDDQHESLASRIEEIASLS